MPRCFLLTVCGRSSLDQDSNNFSLFELVERIEIGAGTPVGLILPLEVHVHFAFQDAELDAAYEFRYVLLDDQGNELRGPARPMRSQSQRLRLRSFGLAVAHVTGSIELRVEWRILDAAEWTRETAWWPLKLAQPPLP